MSASPLLLLAAVALLALAVWLWAWDELVVVARGVWIIVTGDWQVGS